MLNINIELLNLKDSSSTALLHNVNLKLKKGSIYTIIGKNGEGKTTFLKAITNLLDKNKFDVRGKVIYDETDLLQLDERSLSKYRKQKIKYVFQDSLKSFDQLKKLKYYFDLFGNVEETDKLISYFKLPCRAELVCQYPYELSYGMAQRLGFIFALALRPEIILMDEPTSAIDSEVIDLFTNKIKEYSKLHNSIILLVTHDIYFAKDISDFIAILENRTINRFFTRNDFFEKHAYLDQNL